MKPRRPPSKSMRARVLARSSGCCAVCRVPITGRFDVDHIHQRALDGADHEANYRALCVPCHKIKTAADAKARAKVRRLTGANKPKRKRHWPARDLKSPGFKGWRKFDGTPVTAP